MRVSKTVPPRLFECVISGPPRLIPSTSPCSKNNSSPPLLVEAASTRKIKTVSVDHTLPFLSSLPTRYLSSPVLGLLLPSSRDPLVTYSPHYRERSSTNSGLPDLFQQRWGGYRAFVPVGCAMQMLQESRLSPPRSNPFHRDPPPVPSPRPRTAVPPYMSRVFCGKRQRRDPHPCWHRRVSPPPPASLLLQTSSTAERTGVPPFSSKLHSNSG